MIWGHVRTGRVHALTLLVSIVAVGASAQVPAPMNAFQSAFSQYGLPHELFGDPCEEIGDASIFCNSDQSGFPYAHVAIEDFPKKVGKGDLLDIEAQFKRFAEKSGNAILIRNKRSKIPNLKGSVATSGTYHTESEYLSHWAVSQGRRMIYVRVGTKNAPEIEKLEAELMRKIFTPTMFFVPPTNVSKP